MKLIELSQGYFAKIDDCDYAKVSKHKWYAKVRPFYTYASSKIDGKEVKMHRFIMGITERKVVVDHENHDTLDNQKHNLRACSHRQNILNSKTRNFLFIRATYCNIVYSLFFL